MIFCVIVLNILDGGNVKMKLNKYYGIASRKYSTVEHYIAPTMCLSTI
jgi:hypothetical protein